MRKDALYVCLAVVLLLLASCTRAEEQETAPQPAVEPSTASSDPLTGTWSGDWGPSPSDRNTVTLDLQWDGSNLTGTVNPGPDAVPLSNASYNPDTQMIMMEAEVERGGRTIHYTIDGTLEGNTMMGTWVHDDRKGDFKLSKS